MHSMGISVLSLGLAPAGPLLTAAREPVADAIYYGGKVITVDAESTVHEAVAMRGDTIAAVGSTSEVRNLDGDGTRLVDLEGKTLLPGFFDGHIHLVPGRDPAVQPWKYGSLIPKEVYSSGPTP